MNSDSTTSTALARSVGGTVSTTVIEPAPRLCQNCQSPMHGPFCYQCGQHERSSLRHAGLLLRDILNDVFNLDSRAVRTLKPLLLKPGYLTLEYFAGRRQRYVPPLRLYVIASVIFFLAAGLFFSMAEGLQFEGDEQAAEEALNEPEVQAALKDPEVAAALEKASPAMREAMAKRGMGTESRTTEPPPIPESPLPGKPIAPVETADEKSQSQVNVDLPELTFLPDVARLWFNGIREEVKEKSKKIQDDPKRLAEAVLSVLPQSMFILLPLFALLLKLFYPFANRLYMEHLIVALHSHCFMFILFTLLMTINHIFSDAFGMTQRWPWLEELLGAITGLLLAFGVPLYLYLMQKRVYGQGHLLTFSKFVMTGVLYLTLLSLVIAIDIVVGILQM